MVHGRITAALLIGGLALTGCAASRQPPGPPPGPPAAPHPGRYAASPHQITAEDWLGQYRGTGERYAAASGAWAPISHVTLSVFAAAPGHVVLAGSVADTTIFRLDVDLAATPPGVLTGTQQETDGAPLFSYSFALRGPRVTGLIRRYPAGMQPSPEATPDEWMIDVMREIGGP
jgi:hypothetical protein